MTDVPNESLYAEEVSSFRGMIYMLKNGREIPLRLSRAQDKFTWGVIPQDDWLQAGGNEAPPLLTFVFHSQTADRLHFNISKPGRNGPKALGISRNGYLGLYEHAEVTDHWKLEPLEWAEEGLICRWRDHQGHQVKAIADNPHFDQGQYFLLNVTEGETHRFLIRRID